MELTVKGSARPSLFSSRNDIITTTENNGYVHVDSKKEVVITDLLAKCGIEEDPRYGKLGQWVQMFYDTRQSKVRDNDFKKLIRNAKKRYGSDVKPFIDCLRDSGASPYHIGRFLRDEKKFLIAYKELKQQGMLEGYIDETRQRSKAIEAPTKKETPEHVIEEIDDHPIDDDSITAQILKLTHNNKV